jgi:hypothetical protein
MKILIKYISLLIFSGLILPVCGIFSSELQFNKAKQPSPTLIEQVSYTDEKGFSFYEEMGKIIFPVVKF